MSAHVLLNLFNDQSKRDQMRGLPSILSLFRNEFNKFNNTGARILDSIYHMTLRLLNLISGVAITPSNPIRKAQMALVEGVFSNIT